MSLLIYLRCCHRPPDALRKPLKALGHSPAQIMTQSVATYVHDFSATDLETFMTLAKRYVFEGRDRTEICAYNSGVAFAAGHESAAQFWLLLGATLTKYFASPPKISPVRRSNSNGEVSKMVVHNTPASTSRRLTPTSSTASSPRHLPVPLPPSTSRISSLVGRRACIKPALYSDARLCLFSWAQMRVRLSGVFPLYDT